MLHGVAEITAGANTCADPCVDADDADSASVYAYADVDPDLVARVGGFFVHCLTLALAALP